MNKIEINTDIAVAPRAKKPKSDAVKALLSLAVGQSFAIPKNAKERTLRSVASTAKFGISIRTDAHGKRRLWRTK